MKRLVNFACVLILGVFGRAQTTVPATTMPSCCSRFPSRIAQAASTLPATVEKARSAAPENMRWIPGGEFIMGAAESDRDARGRAATAPRHSRWLLDRQDAGD